MIGHPQEIIQNGFANLASTILPARVTENRAVCVTLASRCQIATKGKKVLTNEKITLRKMPEKIRMQIDV